MLETKQPTAPAAGWFPDPWGSGVLRWWDGGQWTAHLQQPVPYAPPQHVYYTGQAQPVAEPPRGIRNAIAGIALSLGFGAFAAFVIGAAFPAASIYLPEFGLAAIVFSILGISRHSRRVSSVLWSPIVGLILGVISEVLLLMVILVSFLPAPTNIAPSNSESSGSTSSDTKPLSMTAGITIADYGHEQPQYLPASNGVLSAAASAEGRLVLVLQADFADGKADTPRSTNWPATLKVEPNGDVVTTQGQDLGNFIQPGWKFSYSINQYSGAYVLQISVLNGTELAVYLADSAEFEGVCLSTDQTCGSTSPHKGMIDPAGKLNDWQQVPFDPETDPND